jgi:hypothetical protein
MPVPISLLVDDACPLVHVYRYQLEHVHAEEPRTRDGRALLDSIPNAFLDAFCDVVDQRGFRGKVSIVPAPASRGDILTGVNSDPAGTRAWLQTVQRRLAARFDFSPEMITHDLAVDLASGRLLDIGESVWSQTQDRTTLQPYLTRALTYLRDAGLDATGITSPWIFGRDVEGEYTAAIVAAQSSVYGRGRSWYFLHTLEKHPWIRPWVEVLHGETALVSIPTTTDDVWWRTIDDPRGERELAGAVADELLLKDGSGGAIRRVLDAGGWPILLTHWQSLYSNGLWTGLRSLDELGRRVNDTLTEDVVWTTCSDLMEMTLSAGTVRPAVLPSSEA